MKERLIRWSRPLLTACMALAFWIHFDVVSIILFGEYEYPTGE